MVVYEMKCFWVRRQIVKSTREFVTTWSASQEGAHWCTLMSKIRTRQAFALIKGTHQERTPCTSLWLWFPGHLPLSQQGNCLPWINLVSSITTTSIVKTLIYYTRFPMKIRSTVVMCFKSSLLSCAMDITSQGCCSLLSKDPLYTSAVWQCS